MSLAPICLFTYNRLKETQQTIESLQKNDLASESELFIFSDGPKNSKITPYVTSVRKYIGNVKGFKSVSVFESHENLGLANSIISGVSQIIEKYGKVIVLEDDLFTSPNFLVFINKALDYYKNEKHIQSINGFSLNVNRKGAVSDVYFQIRPFSWGWATWSDRWDPNIFNKEKLKSEIDENTKLLDEFKKECGDDISKMLVNSINNRNDSWYVRWAYNHFKNKRYSVYPLYSLVENMGFGEAGTHCKSINSYSYIMDNRNYNEFTFMKFKKPKEKITIAFLNNFSLKHKIMVRIKLLGSREGRSLLISEIQMKIKKG